jgi:hypothetical protein
MIVVGHGVDLSGEPDPPLGRVGLLLLYLLGALASVAGVLAANAWWPHLV